MVERCRIRIGTRLGGASEEEVEVGIQGLFGFSIVRSQTGGRLLAR